MKYRGSRLGILYGMRGAATIIHMLKTLNPTAITRIGMAIVFLWFGVDQLRHVESYVFFLPEWISVLPMSEAAFVKLNGWFEIVAGLLLVAGLQTRIIAALLGLHLLGIAWSIGDAIGVRDFGLAVATLGIAIGAPDAWSLDARMAAKKTAVAAGDVTSEQK